MPYYVSSFYIKNHSLNKSADYNTATEGKTVQKILTFEESSEGLNSACNTFDEDVRYILRKQFT